jgi:tetratricopeptide (TPR) repeat protein
VKVERSVILVNKISSLTGGFILILLAACSGIRQIETTASAEEAFRDKDYRTALALSGEIIGKGEARGRQSTGTLYSIAGISAFELGDYSRSLDYLLKAQQQEQPDEQATLYLARNYRHLDNLSREITCLRAYLDKFPDGSEAAEVRKRLLVTCTESEDFELAGRLWMEMDSLSREEPGTLETWLQLNRIQGNDAVCDSVASRILLRDPESEPALEWFGEAYFWKAENQYQYQMKAYRENRTHKQYAILLEAFRQVSADFRRSRDYFLKLFTLNPDPAYASYLANIFTRLEDEEKASYYKKRAD